jgi:hypothetical protein
MCSKCVDARKITTEFALFCPLNKRFLLVAIHFRVAGGYRLPVPLERRRKDETILLIVTWRAPTTTMH